MVKVVQFLRRPKPLNFSIERLYEDVRAHMPPDCDVSTWTCRHPSNGLWQRLQDMLGARKGQSQVNHVTGDVHFLALLLEGHRTILTVHDLVSLGRLRGIKRWIFWLIWYWAPVNWCRIIVVISASTRDELLANVRCDPAKIRLVHNPVSAEFQPVHRSFDSRCPRILLIGTGPNKNIERVAEALSGLSCHVTIIGSPSDQQIQTLRRHGVDYEIRSNLPRQDLVEEYARCDLLVFASTYEGFGLPIVEANAVGRPVVTSNILSMPEVAADAACLVDPFDPASIRAGVLRVIGDPAYRDALVEAGLRNVQRFRVEVVAKAYADLYREVACVGRGGTDTG